MEPVGGRRGCGGTRRRLSDPRAPDQWDPRLLSLEGSLEPKFVGRWGPNIARAFLLLRGTWESLDSATALRPTAANGIPSLCLPPEISSKLVVETLSISCFPICEIAGLAHLRSLNP